VADHWDAATVFEWGKLVLVGFQRRWQVRGVAVGVVAVGSLDHHGIDDGGGAVMVTSTSCPVPGLTEPSLVFTVPETFASLASLLELDLTSVSELRPIAEQVVTFPLRVAVARLSETFSAQADELESARNRPPTSTAPLLRTARPYFGKVCRMACAPVLDGAAIPERLVAVDL
jgi:hypothetical protein